METLASTPLHPDSVAHAYATFVAREFERLNREQRVQRLHNRVKYLEKLLAEKEQILNDKN